jgi:hypothetical protein
MAADKPYGELYDFYVSPEYFGFNLVRCVLWIFRVQVLS